MGVSFRAEVGQGAIMPCGQRRREQTLDDYVAAVAIGVLTRERQLGGITVAN
jgi:hypothetical protein